MACIVKLSGLQAAAVATALGAGAGGGRGGGGLLLAVLDRNLTAGRTFEFSRVLSALLGD